jgi:transcriptional regulator with XRE-family HTH domain
MDLEVGPWLLGNQQGIPPRTPSAIKSDIAMWRDPQAFYGTDNVLRESDFNTGLALSVTDGNFAGNEVVAELLSCWVESPGAVARRIGLSVKELNWYLNNERGLEDAKLYSLLDLLGVDVSMQYERDDGSPVYDAQENYVLFAPDKPAPVVTLYERLSHGGDLDFSVELLPQSGQPDPHWRYLLLGCFVEIHVMAFGRETAAAALLDDAGERVRLINYTGAHRVSARFYQATQRLCAEVQRAPQKQFERMRRYASTHETIFDQLEAHERHY